jgi:hypothetical protein
VCKDLHRIRNFDDDVVDVGRVDLLIVKMLLRAFSIRLFYIYLFMILTASSNRNIIS